MTIKTKILLTATLILIVFGAASLILQITSLSSQNKTKIEEAKASLMEQAEQKLQSLTDIVESNIISLIEQNKAKGLNEQENKAQVLRTIKNIEYDNGNGYFWIPHNFSDLLTSLRSLNLYP